VRGNGLKVIEWILLVLLLSFVLLYIIAMIKKNSSVYQNESSEKNPFEGKYVEFIENDEDKENADGLKGHLAAIGSVSVSDNFYNDFVKRFLDILISFLGLMILSPVFLIICIAIKIDDPGPVFFVQKRVGKNKRYFKLHKFRSMKMSTPHDLPTHMLENPEQYITKVGGFIRKHSLDELPQIWDIFIGNMSIIGPRPALWNQDFLTAERDKYKANDIKPGLTGWSQINGRDELEIEEKARLDGEYVDKLSFLFDCKCFLGTVFSVIKEDGVVEGGTGQIKTDDKTGDNS
jgi:lipopolysaccharide/colanic/teichoic acid biosynthesis glycosyltransferase